MSIAGSEDNTVRLWSNEKVLAKCEEGVKFWGDMTCSDARKKFFFEDKDHPNWFGEGPMVTTSMAVSKSVFKICISNNFTFTLTDIFTVL